jgi:hypothetical protein
METGIQFLQSINNLKIPNSKFQITLIPMKLYKTVLMPLLFLPSLLLSQNIENVKSYLSEDKVIITYDIIGGRFFNYYTISLYVSRDNGNTYEGPLQEVSGDVGENIRHGSHQITWDAMKEIPFVDQNFKFDVKAEIFEDELKPSIFISYVGNTVTPIGLRIGMIGRIGWYVEGRMNLIAFDSPAYTYKDGEIIDYDQPGYYEFTSGKGYSAFSALGGITYQPGRNMFLYAGTGYAWEKYLYEITNYSYEDDQPIGKSNVVHDDYNLSGFELDAGAMYRFNMILVSAGATTLNFKNIWWTVGVGVVF